MNEPKKQLVSIKELAPLLEKAISGGAKAEITVTGRSMRPLLLDRVSRVRLSALTDPKKGDMILFRRQNGDYVLHRLIREEKDGSFVFCGDGQCHPETGILREQMLALVCEFARKKRWIAVSSPLYRLWWHAHLLTLPARRFCSRCLRFIARHFRPSAKK